MFNSNNLKVIVVGGGPVGLVAAHALSRAGIDFAVLESRSSPVIDAGSNLVLSANGMRALGQLGLMDDLRQVSSELGKVNRLDHHGNNIGDVEWFIQQKIHFGEYPRVLSRHDLTKVLYDGLTPEAQAKIHVNKRVSDVAKTADGVEVSCRDGSSFSGTFVIGADGAHSMVRDSMRTIALDAGSPNVNEEKPFLVTFRCLWIRFPTDASDKLTPGLTAEAHGPRCASQLFTGTESGVAGIYERLDEATRERIRYTEEDQDALVQRWGHLQLLPGMDFTLGDAYDKKIQSGLVSLEEGVVEHWSYQDRIVLAGDAAHKFTPSTGAGCNNGIVDIVVLLNELHKVVEEARHASNNENARPSKEKIEAAFEAYQEARRETTKEACKQSGDATAMATWESSMLKFIDRWVLSSRTAQRYLISSSAGKTAATPVLTYVPGKEALVGGKTPWVQPMPVQA